MPLPSLPALRAFDAAARLGSFKAAAEALNVSPTAVSHHIRGLEDQLQVALFARSARQITLTAEGRRLAEATGAAFSGIEAAISELRKQDNILTISATPAFASLWLAPRLDTFERRHPGIRVRMLSSTRRTDFRQDSEVDIAIRYGRSTGNEAVLSDDSIGAFAAPHYLDQLGDIGDAEFFSTRWESESLPAAGWPEWCHAAGIAPVDSSRTREFRQEQEVLQAGLAGRGLILMSNLLAQDYVDRRWLLPFRPDVVLGGFAYWTEANAQRAGAKKLRPFQSWLDVNMGRKPRQ